MAEAKTKSKTKKQIQQDTVEEAPAKEQLIDTVMRVMKSNHNWKLMAGVVIGWLICAYI